GRPQRPSASAVACSGQGVLLEPVDEQARRVFGQYDQQPHKKTWCSRQDTASSPYKMAHNYNDGYSFRDTETENHPMKFGTQNTTPCLSSGRNTRFWSTTSFS